MATTADIPVIDITAEGVDEAQVAKELVDAAVEHGFVYIRNTGRAIPVEAIDNAFSISEKIFDSPLEEKQRCTIQTNNRGWSGMHTETLDPKNQRVGDFKEAFNFGPFHNSKAQQPLPAPILPQEPEAAAFASACHALCQRIMHLLGQGLSVTPPSFFVDAHDTTNPQASSSPSSAPLESGTILRLLRYPPPTTLATAPHSSDVRAGAHSDYGSITLLFRLPGQGGLEVLSSKGEGGGGGSGAGQAAWAAVPVVPRGCEHDPAPPVLVNIGDLLSYWTDGLLRSTVHRVVFDRRPSAADAPDPQPPRYSIAYFFHPVDATPLTPVPSERVRAFAAAKATRGSAGTTGDLDSPYAARKVLTAKEHLLSRLAATYGDLYKDEKE